MNKFFDFINIIIEFMLSAIEGLRVVAVITVRAFDYIQTVLSHLPNYFYVTITAFVSIFIVLHFFNRG